MKSKGSNGFPGALGLFLLSFTLVSCTLALDTSAVQCRSDKDCQSAQRGAASLVCRAQVCIVDDGSGSTGSDPDPSTGGIKPPDDKPMLPFAVDDAFFTSGYMGDGERQLITEHACAAGQRGGKGRGRCHKFIYETGPMSMGWGGLYWQYPANNWGKTNTPGYLIPPGAKSVAFYAWASASGPPVTFDIGISQADGFQVPSSEVLLSASPKRYVIDLGDVSYEDVVGAFSFSTKVPLTGSSELYLDDIVWSADPARVATTFAVTSGAPLLSGCVAHLRGSFDDWGDGVAMRDDDKDEIYEVSVELAPNREVQYRFGVRCDGGPVADEALSSDAACAPVSADGGPARVTKVPHESSRVALACQAACGACGAKVSAQESEF